MKIRSRPFARDAVLVEEMVPVTVTVTGTGQEVDALCLPLKYIPGWLFGLNADRVKPEIRERLIRYQRECFDVLAEAFQEGRLTADPVLDDLLLTDSDAVQAYKMLQALVKPARNQVLIESQLQSHSDQLVDHDQRLENIESTLGDTGKIPGRHELAQRMARRDGRPQPVLAHFWRTPCDPFVIQSTSPSMAASIIRWSPPMRNCTTYTITTPRISRRPMPSSMVG